MNKVALVTGSGKRRIGSFVADALAARMVGGPGPYLRVLAQMALREEDRLLAWPVRTFLPAHGTLMRRIQMLREPEMSRRPALRL